MFRQPFLLVATFLFVLNEVKCEEKEYFNGQVKLKCSDEYMNIWIEKGKAEEMETEGTIESLQLRRSPQMIHHESCEAWLDSEGWYHLEVSMTPKKHECAYGYKILEDGTLYEFEAGFKISMPEGRKYRKLPAPTLKFSCIANRDLIIPDLTLNVKEETIGFEIENQGTYVTHMHVYSDPGHQYEHVGSKLGEVPLNKGRLYVKYHTPADKDLEVHDCELSTDSNSPTPFFNYHCPIPQYPGTTLTKVTNLGEGGTSAAFSFDPEDFQFEENVGYLKCDVIMTERGKPTYTANVANCGRFN